MVDGINTIGATSVRGSVVREATTREQIPVTQTQVGQTNTQDVTVSAAIRQAADKTFASLSSGNVQKFLEVAEEFINNSLPKTSPPTRLRINQDDDTGRYVYQGVDVNTGEVIRQFPADEVLKFIAFAREQAGSGIEGIVLDDEA